MKLIQKFWTSIPAIFALAFMLGCQGLSTGKPGSQQQSGALGLATSSLDFGSVSAGTSKTLSVNATNSGDSSVTISAASFSTKYFSLSTPSLPVTIAAGQSVPLGIVFSPDATGSFSATATITSDASDAAAILSLTGTGGDAGQLAITPNNESFGNFLVGTTKLQNVTMTNNGTNTVTISSITSNSDSFVLSNAATPITIGPAKTASFGVTFVAQAAGVALGTITITSNASNSTLTMPLGGTGLAAGALISNPTSLPFGNVQVNNNRVLPETLTNIGGANVTISAASASGTGFSVSGLSLPATLAPSQSVSFNVTFAPTTAAASSGNLTVTSDGTNPTLIVPLSGTGTSAAVGTLSVNPTSLNVGNVTVGSSGTANGTLTASGASVTVTAASSNNARFSLSGLSLPVTIPSGQSVPFTATFSPLAAGAASATLTFTSDASPSTTTASVSGTGTAVATPVLTVNPTSLNVGNVTVGSSGTANGTLVASGAAVTVTAASSNNARFSLSGLSLPVTIQAGQSVPFTATFSPLAAGAASATLTFTSNATPSTTTASVSGTGTAVATPVLTVNPTSLAVGNVAVGSSGTANGTLVASGAAVTVTAASSNNARFSLSGLSLPVTIQAGQSVPFTATFSPLAAGAASATLTFSSNATPSTTTASVSGTGTAVTTPVLSVNPTSLNVGNVAVGSSGTANGSLTATGGDVTVTAASSNNSRFSVSGLSLPVTIPSGQSVLFTVTFSPQVSGAATASLTFTSNASPSTTTESLSGTGTSTTPHTVDLSWTASTSPNISGYNIYRAVFSGSACGSYSKINTALNTDTTFTDSNPGSTGTYCYAATSVNSSSEESGFSNIAQAVIP